MKPGGTPNLTSEDAQGLIRQNLHATNAVAKQLSCIRCTGRVALVITLRCGCPRVIAKRNCFGRIS